MQGEDGAALLSAGAAVWRRCSCPAPMPTSALPRTPLLGCLSDCSPSVCAPCFCLPPSLQRLRDIINKGLTNEELLRGVKTAWDKGWRQIKLYYMIGRAGGWRV